MKVTVIATGHMDLTFVAGDSASSRRPAAALALFAASLSLLFSGAGRFSVDRALSGRR